MMTALPMPPRRIGRFLVRRWLGKGSYGEVFEVEDTLTGDNLALKKLRTEDPTEIYRFKKEFRALADVLHPNLVRMHDLFTDGDDWWLTMDLVLGEDLRTFARRPGSDLHDLMRQLVAGVAAIHRAGKLHRDLKPANVLVTADGHLVILDYGVAGPVGAASFDVTNEGGSLLGTPSYMAPEQVAGDDPTQAWDWYAVGVILFELLTGHLPFTGTVLDVLRRKEQEDAPAARQHAPDAPPALAELCDLLLTRDPRARPDVAAIATTLGMSTDIADAPQRDPGLIGRTAAVAALDEAFELASHGPAVLVLVKGESGVGKSALVHAYLRARASAGVRILGGRCYERESMPFKAVDGVVDAVARAIAAHSTSLDAILLPAGMAALGQIFPSILRVAALATAAATEAISSDRHEVRRQGFTALSHLVAGLAEAAPVVVFIDDLQWGDGDSADLLVDLMGSTVVRRVLFIAAHRAENDRPGGVVQMLRDRLLARAGTATHELVLAPLGEDDALELARASLDPSHRDLAITIAREAGGNPFLVQELVRASARTGAAVPLADILRDRIDGLGEPARQILDVVAAAGYPIAGDVVRAATQRTALGSAIAELRLARLVRSRDIDGIVHLECFHDRVRELVAARLDRDERLAGCHLALGEALEALRRGEPDHLATHFHVAGDRARARRYAELAAAAATAALAFDRAVVLTQRALRNADGDDQHRLRVALAEALTLAGRPREAADGFLAAVPDAVDSRSARALRRQAADQLLQGGYLDEGTATMRQCLVDVGVPFPTTRTRAILAALAGRARLRLQLAPRHRPRRPATPELAERIDTIFAAGLGLSQTAPLLSDGFLSRHLTLALTVRDPDRLARGLALAAILAVASGAHEHGERLLARTRAAAAISVRPQTAIWPVLAEANGAFLRSHFRSALAGFEHALELAARHGAGTWEVGTAKHYCMMVLAVTGDGHQLARQVTRHVRDAQERGDRYTEVSLRAWCTAESLLHQDRARDAEDESASAMSRWSGTGFHLQHSHEVYARAQCALYLCEPTRAYRMVTDAWPRAVYSGLMNIRLIQIRFRDIQARAALAEGSPAGLRDARRQLRALRRERVDYAAAAALQIEATLAHLTGRREAAAALLARARDAWMAIDALPRALALQRMRGRLLGADGAAAVGDADARLEAAAIRNPARFAAMLAPGFDHGAQRLLEG